MAAVIKVFSAIFLLVVVAFAKVQGQNDSLATDLAQKLMAAGFTNILGELDTAKLYDEVTSYVSAGQKATIFMPKDNYFPAHVDTGFLAYLRANPSVLREVLKFHLVPNYLLKKDRATVELPFVKFSDGATYPTFNEKASVKITFNGAKRNIEGSVIRFPDAVVVGELLVVHGINGLLVPPYLASQIPLSNETCRTLGQCSSPPRRPRPAQPPALSPTSAPSLSPEAAPEPAPEPASESSAAPTLPPSTAPAPGPSIVNYIVAALKRAGYLQLASLIESSDLILQYTADLLPGPVTLLAPDDNALALSLNANVTAMLRSNPSLVLALLDRHIIPDIYLTYTVLNKDLDYRSKEANATLYFKYNAANSTATVALTKERLPANESIISPTPILGDGRISILGINKVIMQGGVTPPPTSAGVRLGQAFASIVAVVISLLMA
eukprot:TRINITY_DN21531_c0_g1_i1.p1 TRINITY_DN21531_c0_g1~~TRINITY_DN21531_c0_g1_i1.p1  ORF type:complete len:438 (+),score=78.87 TRINITY_DN21531_c0_g1_i1:78-1391(+)